MPRNLLPLQEGEVRMYTWCDWEAFDRWLHLVVKSKMPGLSVLQSPTLTCMRTRLHQGSLPPLLYLPLFLSPNAGFSAS